MEHYVDWNCKLLSPGISTADTASALLELDERFGFRHFYMLQDFNAATESVTAFRIRQRRVLRELKSVLPRRLHVRGAACVQFYEGLSKEADLEKLLISSERLLPLQMPLAEYGDWIDRELNHLLYKRKILPLFLSFELCMVLYPKEIIEKLLRIPLAAYQFNYKSLQNPDVCRAIFKLLSKSTVLLGTSINLPPKIGYYELPYYLECAKKHLYGRFANLLLERTRDYWDEL